MSTSTGTGLHPFTHKPISMAYGSPLSKTTRTRTVSEKPVYVNPVVPKLVKPTTTNMVNRKGIGKSANFNRVNAVYGESRDVTNNKISGNRNTYGGRALNNNKTNTNTKSKKQEWNPYMSNGQEYKLTDKEMHIRKMGFISNHNILDVTPKKKAVKVCVGRNRKMEVKKKVEVVKEVDLQEVVISPPLPPTKVEEAEVSDGGFKSIGKKETAFNLLAQLKEYELRVKGLEDKLSCNTDDDDEYDEYEARNSNNECRLLDNLKVLEVLDKNNILKKKNAILSSSNTNNNVEVNNNMTTKTIISKRFTVPVPPEVIQDTINDPSKLFLEKKLSELELMVNKQNAIIEQLKVGKIVGNLTNDKQSNIIENNTTETTNNQPTIQTQQQPKQPSIIPSILNYENIATYITPSSSPPSKIINKFKSFTAKELEKDILAARRHKAWKSGVSGDDTYFTELGGQVELGIESYRERGVDFEEREGEEGQQSNGGDDDDEDFNTNYEENNSGLYNTSHLSENLPVPESKPVYPTTQSRFGNEKKHGTINENQKQFQKVSLSPEGHHPSRSGLERDSMSPSPSVSRIGVVRGGMWGVTGA